MHAIHRVNHNQKDIDNALTQLRGVMLYDTTAIVKPAQNPVPPAQTPVQPVQPTQNPVPPAQTPVQPVQPAFHTALNVQDPLFWCLYIMKNGAFKYEQVPNRFTAERDCKRDEIIVLRDRAKQLKQSTGIKFTASTIEGDIMGIITLHAFQVLVHLNSLNAVFVNPHNRVYAEFISDAVSNKPVYLIKRKDKNTTRLIMTQATDHELTSLRATHHRIENLKKPIKSVSAYTVAELIEMCHTLKIQMTHKMKKQEMYDMVVKQLML